MLCYLVYVVLRNKMNFEVKKNNFNSIIFFFHKLEKFMAIIWNFQETRKKRIWFHFFLGFSQKGPRLWTDKLTYRQTEIQIYMLDFIIFIIQLTN